jgi:phage I-like protein
VIKEAVRPAGYWVEVADAARFRFFDDGSNMSWIQAVPLGTYDHPVYGEMTFSPEKLNDMLANIKNNVRGTELDIDYDHKDFGDGKAAGWVKDAELRGSDGLWILVEWTPPARQALANREYKYFSPEFSDEWTHPKTGQTFKNVLFGGALTNRPHLKDIQPINLSEIRQRTQSGDGVEEFIKLLREALGLPEDTDQDKLLSEIKALKAKPAPSADPPQGSKLDESELAKLAESSPAVKALKEAWEASQTQREEDRKRLAALEASARFRETEAGVAAACKLSDAYTIAPAHQETLVKLLAVMPKQLSDKVVAALGDIVKEGIVELGERGRLRPGGRETSTDDPVDAWDTEVAKLRETDKTLSYAEACVRLSSENPDLWAEYADASYAGTMRSDD